MQAIYEPRGAALEYSPLAANLYSGCAHGCTYCYAPACLRRSRENFRQVSVRKDILKHLERDARALAGDQRPVLLSFTSDPYQPAEIIERVTSAAIAILAENGLNVRVLTKNPALALELDGDLLVKAKVELGSTIIFARDAVRRMWEPQAAPVESRMEAIRQAHALGLKTWISVEPVIDPNEAIAVMEALSGAVDMWKVGRWNHDSRAHAIDWPRFATAAITLLRDRGARYYIKDALWQAAGDDVRGRFQSQTG